MRMTLNSAGRRVREIDIALRPRERKRERGLKAAAAARDSGLVNQLERAAPDPISPRQSLGKH